MSTYSVWTGSTPLQTNHPYVLHPDWISSDNNGATYDGKDYWLDQAHPAVQQHLFNVAMDIVGNYDVDGFNLDCAC